MQPHIGNSQAFLLNYSVVMNTYNFKTETMLFLTAKYV